MSQSVEPGSRLATELPRQRVSLGQTATEDVLLRLTHTHTASTTVQHLLMQRHGQALQPEGITASKAPCKALTKTGQTATSGQDHLQLSTEWML